MENAAHRGRWIRCVSYRSSYRDLAVGRSVHDCRGSCCSVGHRIARSRCVRRCRSRQAVASATHRALAVVNYEGTPRPRNRAATYHRFVPGAFRAAQPGCSVAIATAVAMPTPQGFATLQTPKAGEAAARSRPQEVRPRRWGGWGRPPTQKSSVRRESPRQRQKPA